MTNKPTDSATQLAPLSEADARLFAAAPALREATKWLYDLIDVLTRDDPSPTYGEAQLFALEALAQAGEEWAAAILRGE